MKNYSTFYDRKSRSWKVVDGKGVVGGFGDEKEARIFILHAQSPEIAKHMSELIEINSDGSPSGKAIKDRLLKGAELVSRGAVYPPRAFAAEALLEVAQVENGQGVRYSIQQISLAPIQLVCDCEDFRIKQAPISVDGQRVCKHVAATIMWEKEEYNRQYNLRSEHLAKAISLAMAARSDLSDVISFMQSIQGRLSQANLDRLRRRLQPYQSFSGNIRFSFPLSLERLEKAIESLEQPHEDILQYLD